MVKDRVFSLYDIEQFLKDAGAERVNERAVVSLEEELQSTVKELITQAEMYANYAGRKRLIKSSDILLVSKMGRTNNRMFIAAKKRKIVLKKKMQRNTKIVNFSIETKRLY